jgi:ketosteroid isomerase-like protein
MSRENLRALKAVYDGWAAGDMSAGVSLFDANVVYLSQGNEPDPGPHFGVEAMIAWMRRFLANWDDFRMEAIDYRTVGDTILVRIRRSAVGKESRVPIREEGAIQAWSFRGAKVIRLEIFRDEQEAFEAVGLRE